MFKPWLFLYRTRLITAAVASVLLAVFILFWTTAESLTDIGVLWHHFCGCALDPDDARVLLNAPGLVGAIVGLIVCFPNPGRAQLGAAGAFRPYGADTTYLLTRPMRRSTVLLTPFFIIICSIVVLPAMAFLLLYGWLRAVHAPSLGHIIGLLQLVPGAVAAGPHPSFFSLLLADGFLQRYIAAVSAGLCVGVLFAAHRWFLLSPNPRIRLAGLFPSLMFLITMARLINKEIFAKITMAAVGPLSSPSSWANIALHFAFAIAIVYACWRIQRTVEL